MGYPIPVIALEFSSRTGLSGAKLFEGGPRSQLEKFQGAKSFSRHNTQHPSQTTFLSFEN